MDLTVEELVERLAMMPPADIRAIGRRVRAEHRSAAEEAAWWQATARVDRSVRRLRLRCPAALSGTQAARAVKAAAARAGLSTVDPDVVATARAASDAARALVASKNTAWFLDRLGSCVEARSLVAAAA